MELNTDGIENRNEIEGQFRVLYIMLESNERKRMTEFFIFLFDKYKNIQNYIYLLLSMAILPRPAWPAPPHFVPCEFSPPRKGGGARMGQDFNPVPRGGAGRG